ncbi:hypothetical protein RB653_003452 [Dictyostelium firmibasis]|uniref:Uncharacterized protein n=1 Tax=Dictyostelium firmibasis TaxID=79012 RepID=A0AAN7YZ43_9MYCE
MLIIKNLLVLVTLALLFTLSSGQYTFDVTNSNSTSNCKTAIAAKLTTCNTGCINSFQITQSTNGKSLVFSAFQNSQCSGDLDAKITFDCKSTPVPISSTKYTVSCQATTNSTTSGNPDSSSGSSVMVGIASSLFLTLASVFALFAF